MKNIISDIKTNMTEELSQTRLYFNTPLNNSNTTGLPLINLDWGSTNLPLRCVEEKVMERVWASHGNPGSCGSYTGSVSKHIIDEVSNTILDHLNSKGEVYYGGYGASHWLRKISENHPDDHLIIVQKELHDSLISPWKNIHRYETKCMDQLTWIRRLCNKFDPKKLFLGIALSSHLTGATFEDKLGIIDFCHELGIRVIIDATCYLAHHQKPKIPYFDYLVFSPHKLPGGPGSCGVMVARKTVTWGTEPGSKNIPGIVRIEESLKLLKRLKEPENINELIGGFVMKLSLLKRGNYSIETMFWDDAPITEPHFLFRVNWKSPDGVTLQVHPNLVAMICTHVYGLQIRGGGVCAESFSSNNLEGLLKTGFCRISVPRYLFTLDMAENISGKLDDMLKYMNYYVRCYQIGKMESWEVRPEITSIPRTKNHSVNTSCCSGPSGTFRTDKGKDEPLRGGMMVIDWLIPDTWTKIIARKLNDRFLEDPDRWFLHPEDLRKCDIDI